jgi:hypothetical protein
MFPVPAFYISLFMVVVMLSVPPRSYFFTPHEKSSQKNDKPGKTTKTTTKKDLHWHLPWFDTVRIGFPGVRRGDLAGLLMRLLRALWLRAPGVCVILLTIINFKRIPPKRIYNRAQNVRWRLSWAPSYTASLPVECHVQRAFLVRISWHYQPPACHFPPALHDTCMNVRG